MTCHIGVGNTELDDLRKMVDAFRLGCRAAADYVGARGENCRGFREFRLPFDACAAIGIVAGGTVTAVELLPVCQVCGCPGGGRKVPLLFVGNVLLRA